MNKKYIILIILIIAVILGIVYFFIKNNTNTNQPNYNSARTSQNALNESNSTENATNTESNENQNSESEKNEENNSTENEQNSEEKNKDEKDSQNENSKKDEQKESDSKNTQSSKETEIASFTTKIYTKDSGRQNNLSIACSTLNNTTIDNGKTFSFSKTVGKATSGKGYKKADVFRNGDVIEALGGGLCQVSTTLYNAVLKIPELKVTERHPHSNKVPYIKSGKDAAVSFGAQDFKFVNNTGNKIKIKASNTKNNVTVKILKIE